MEDILRSGFAELGIEPDGKAFERYNTYFEYLEERNAVMNLTAISGREDVARLHFLDCAALLSVCDFKDKTVIEAKGHAWESDFTVDKEPTCTESGSKSIHCADCDAVKDVTVIAPHDHSWDEGKVTKESTTLENGEKVLTCTECGQTETVSIPALVIPQTGDNSNIAIWLGVLVMSGLGVSAVVASKKKEEN